MIGNTSHVETLVSTKATEIIEGCKDRVRQRDQESCFEMVYPLSRDLVDEGYSPEILTIIWGKVVEYFLERPEGFRVYFEEPQDSGSDPALRLQWGNKVKPEIVEHYRAVLEGARPPAPADAPEVSNDEVERRTQGLNVASLAQELGVSWTSPGGAFPDMRYEHTMGALERQPLEPGLMSGGLF